MHQLLLSLLVIWSVTSCQAKLTSYGNDVIRRSGPHTANETREQRIWIDDFKDVSYPGWGFLYSFKIFINSGLPEAGPPLRLQIWSNTTYINHYILKWETPLENYKMNNLYELTVERTSMIEITEFDRIGFTNFGLFMPVAYTFEIDDAETMSTAHRTYWTYLSKWGIAPAKVGEKRVMDNFAVRATFSIGIVLDNEPPRTATQTYHGHDLKSRDSVMANMDKAYPTAYLDSTELPSGYLVRFYYKLAQLEAPTTLYLFLLRPNIKTYTGSLVWWTKVEIPAGPEGIRWVDLPDSPAVEKGIQFGWMFDGYNPLFYSTEVAGNARTYRAQFKKLPPTKESDMSVDSLPWPHVYSIGAIVDKKKSGGGAPISTTTPSPLKSSTTNRNPNHVKPNDFTKDHQTALRSTSYITALGVLVLVILHTTW